MAEPTREELATIQRERAAMFRPAWFADLVKGKLRLGETFWGGHLGIQLVMLPIWLLVVVAIPGFAPGIGRVTIALFYGLQAVWSLAVTQAVVRVAPGATQAGGWRWVAIALSVVNSVTTIYLLSQWFAGDL